LAEDYAYIVARLRALEAAMPERSWFERLARTPDESLMGMLREYYPSFEDVNAADDFERALEADKVEVLELVTSLLQEERTRQFIRAGYDFENLTHAWKAAQLGVKGTLTPFGLVPPPDVERTISGTVRGILPPYLESLTATLGAALEATKSLAACEYAGEAAKWRFLFEVAPDGDARSYLSCKIDLINIKNFVRLRRTALRREALDAVWLEGGEIETGKLKVLFREAHEELYSFLATSVRKRLIDFGLAAETPLWKIDPIMRQTLMDALAPSRYRFFDLSPVLYHMELREWHYEILRRIIVDKLNRWPEGMALDRLSAQLSS